VLAALSETTDSWGVILFRYFHNFCFAYSSSIRSYVQSGTILESAAADINHAYAAIKLWLLLAQKNGHQVNYGLPHAELTGRGPNINLATLWIWNELWPHFESLVNILEVDAQAGNVSVSLSYSVCVMIDRLASTVALSNAYMVVCGEPVRLCSTIALFP
jgi:hypothetical protein